MKVFLHIGVGKTGTTSLQVFLNRFRPEIELQGYHILSTGSVDSGASHHYLANGFGFAGVKPVETSELIREVSAELALNADKKILISSENFHSRVTKEKLEHLQRAFGNAEVEIIMYVRRQDQWIDSAYRQFVEAGNQQPMDAIINHIMSVKAVDYLEQYQLWGGCFGWENLTIRIYETQQMKGGDTIRDFASVIGLDLSPEMEGFQHHANPSLTTLETELLRLVNRVSRQKSQTWQALRDVLSGDETIDHQLYHCMSYEQRQRIMAFYAESNARLAREYFGREDRRLFYDDLPQPQERHQVLQFSGTPL